MEQGMRPEFVIRDVTSSPRVFITATSAGRLQKDDDQLTNEAIIWGTDDGQIIVDFLEDQNQSLMFDYTDIHKKIRCQDEESPSEEIKKVEAVGISTNRQHIFIHYKEGYVAILKVKIEVSETDNNLRKVAKSVPKVCYLRGWKALQQTFAKAIIFENQLVFPVEPHYEQSDRKRKITINQFQLESFIPGDDTFSTSKTSQNIRLLNEKNIGLVSCLKIFRIGHNLQVLLAFEEGSIVLHCSQNLESIDFEVQSTIKAHQGIVTCLDFNEDEMKGISGSIDDKIAFWSIEKKDDHLVFEVSKLKLVDIANNGILCCAIRPDGRIAVTGGSDGRIRVFGLRTGKPLAIIFHHTDIIQTITFMTTEEDENKVNNIPNNPKYLLFAASNDRSISVWSLYNK